MKTRMKNYITPSKLPALTFLMLVIVGTIVLLAIIIASQPAAAHDPCYDYPIVHPDPRFSGPFVGPDYGVHKRHHRR